MNFPLPFGNSADSRLSWPVKCLSVLIHVAVPMMTLLISRLGLSAVAVSSALEVVAGSVGAVATAVVSADASVAVVAFGVVCVAAVLTLNSSVDPWHKRHPVAKPCQPA